MVYASCLQLDSVRGQLKGQLTRHASVDKTRHVPALLSPISPSLYLFCFVFFNENVKPMPNFFLKFCHSFD